MHKLIARWIFLFQSEDGIRDGHVTGVQTCALPILSKLARDITNRFVVGICRSAKSSVKTDQNCRKFEANLRSEERRVGKEGKCGWRPNHGKHKRIKRTKRKSK